MTVQVGHLFKKRILRNSAGQILDLFDETSGGYIIKRGQIVNQEAYKELLKKEEDRKVAATAEANQISAPQSTAEERTASPSKMEALEKRINDQDAKLEAKLDAILNLLKK